MTPRKPRQDLRDRKARSIAEAAAEVFAEHGFTSARVADIAARAGIGKGTVYEYFRSKEEVFLAVFDAFAADTLEETLAALEPQPASPVAFIRSFADTVLRTLAENLHFYPLTMEFWSAMATSDLKDRLMKEFRKLYASYRAVLARAIREGVAAGEVGAHVDPDHVAAVLVSAIDAVFLQAWVDPAFDPVAAGSHFVDIVLRGMAPAAGRSAGPTGK